MRTGSYLYLVLISLCIGSCVDKAYDIKEIQDMNTDMNFGGEHFSIPIGSFDPILLGRFIQAGDLLKLSEGQYEFSYENNQTSVIETIKPMNFDISAVPIAGIPVDLDGISINDIDLPDIEINETVNVPVQAGQAGAFSTTVLMDNVTSPINILYEYSEEIKQVNYILFGASSLTHGERLEVMVTPRYGSVLTDGTGTTTINNFAITFPYGFRLSADPADPYGGTISPDGKTYNISTQLLQEGQMMTFFVHQITFDPARDQQVKGKLRYNQLLNYSGKFTIEGQATGIGGSVGVALFEKETLTLQDGNFNTNLFTAEVPLQDTPVEVDEKIDDPSIQNVRKITLAQRTPIQINLDVTGLPTRIPYLTLKDYTVHFPDFMDFEDPQINASKSLVLNDQIPNGGRLNKEIYLTGFTFKDNPVLGDRLIVSGVVTSSGGISLNPIDNLFSSEIGNIIIKPDVTLGTMTAGTIEAVVKPNVPIDPVEIKVNLASDMDFLRQSVLDLDRIALQVRVENPTGIAAQIGVNLTPFDQNNNPISDNTVVQRSGLTIKPNTTSELWLSNTKTGMPEGYTFIENPDMSKIFRTLPNRVETLMEVLSEELSSVIDLTNPQPTELQIQYALVAPISLGKDFKLVYKERVTGLQNQLSEMLKYTRALEVTIDAQSNIPLELQVSAIGLDASGNAIPIKIEIQGTVASGTAQGAYKPSTVVLSIEETEPNALNRLDQIELIFVGSANPDGVGAPLLDTQALKLAMSAKIPGGLNIKLKE